MFLEKSDFKKVVLLAPLISIDLCILKKNKLLIGQRKNSPAKNFYFVPGGRVRKNEHLDQAINRILLKELGYKFTKKKNLSDNFLGFFEHFYEDNFQDNKNFSTHYVVLAFSLNFDYIIDAFDIPEEEDQHSNYIWYDLNHNNKSKLSIHEYTQYYINRLL